jgi:hypothetical protein
MSTYIHFSSKSSEHALHVIERHVTIGKSIHVIEIDQRLPVILRSSTFCSTYTYEHFLDQNELEDIDKQASIIAENWFYIHGKDITLLNKISVGKTVELLFFYELVLILKNALTAIKLFRGNAIEKFYIGNGVSLKPEVWEKAAKATEINFEHLSKNQDSLNTSRSSGFLNTDKLIYFFQKVSSRLRNTFVFLPAVFFFEKKKVIFIKGRATTEGWLQDLQASDFDLNEIDKNRISPSVMAWLFSKVRFSQRLEKYRQDMTNNSIWEYSGVDLSSIFTAQIENFFTSVFPVNYAAILAFRQYLRLNRAEALVVPWHNLSPVHFLACQGSSIPLFTLQDSWLPGEDFPVGYGRLIRTPYLCTWGKISTSWAKKLPQCGRVIDIGRPKSSTLWKQDSALDLTDQARPFTVLFTHQCWGAWSAFHSPLDTNDFFDTIAEVAKKLPDICFLCKIHPLVDDPLHEGKYRFRDIENQIQGYGLSNLEVISKQVSMNDALAICDSVITYYSLTAVEALVNGKSVIMMNLTQKRDLFPELFSYGVAARATNSEELVDAIDYFQNNELQKDREKLSRLLDDIFSEPRNLSVVLKDELGLSV